MACLFFLCKIALVIAFSSRKLSIFCTPKIDYICKVRVSTDVFQGCYRKLPFHFVWYVRAEEVLRDYSAGPSQQAPEEESTEVSEQEAVQTTAGATPNASVTESEVAAETNINEDGQAPPGRDLFPAVSDPSTVIELEKSDEEGEQTNWSGGQGTDGGGQNESNAAGNYEGEVNTASLTNVFQETAAAGNFLSTKKKSSVSCIP